MKTSTFNPSPIELEFAQAITDLQTEIQKKIKSNKIIDIQNNYNSDNPTLTFKLEDSEGDRHELVMRFIQRMED
jgi:hypothetical protein